MGLQDFQNSIEDFSKVIQLIKLKIENIESSSDHKSNLPNVYFYRGWSYYRLSNHQQAKIDWQTADELYEMQMNNSANAKKVKEFLNHPSIKNLEIS